MDLTDIKKSPLLKKQKALMIKNEKNAVFVIEITDFFDAFMYIDYFNTAPECGGLYISLMTHFNNSSKI